MSKAGLFSGEVTPLAPADGSPTTLPRSFVWMEFGGAPPVVQGICTTVWQDAVLTPTLHVAGDVAGIYNDGIIIGIGLIEDDRIDNIYTTNDKDEYTVYAGFNPGLETGIAQVFFPECQWFNYCGRQLDNQFAGHTFDMTDTEWGEFGGGSTVLDTVGIAGLPNRSSTATNDSGALFEVTKKSTLGSIPPNTSPMVCVVVLGKETAISYYTRIKFENDNAPKDGIEILIKLDTGVAFILAASTGSSFGLEVRDSGLWWEIFLQVAADGSLNNEGRIVFTPNFNSDGSEVQNIIGVGSFRLGDSRIYTETTIAEVRGGAFEPRAAGASSVIDQSNIHIDAANHSNTQGGYYIEWRPLYSRTEISNDVEILSLNDAAGLLYYDPTTAMLKATDGTNTAVITLVLAKEQKYRIAVIFGSSTLSVAVNGVFGTEVAYDGSFAGGSDFTVFRNPEAINYWRELRGYQDTYAATLTEVAGLMAATDLAVPPNQAYDPLMMTFNGIDGFYNTSNTVFTGNKVRMVFRVNIASFSGGGSQRIIGEFSTTWIRILAIVRSNDFAVVEERNKLIIFSQSSTGATICSLLSLSDVADGQDHTIFAAYDGDNGVATYYIDGVNADDLGYVSRVLVTGSMETANGVSYVGARHDGVVDFVNGQIGYAGIKDAYGTNFQDFMDGALPRIINNQIWTEWDGQPDFWHDESTMDASEGSKGVMTVNGTITGPS